MHKATQLFLRSAAVGVVALVFAAVFASISTPQAHAASAGTNLYCSYQLRGLVNALTEIDGRLNSGINLPTYSAYLGNAEAAYSKVPWGRTYGSCLTYVGLPAQRALNYYGYASNIWMCWSNQCYQARQRDWANASANVARAVNALG